MPPCSQRLEAARSLVAILRSCRVPTPPVHIADQVAAATEDAHHLARQLATALLAEEGQRWKARFAGDGTDDLEVSVLDEMAARILVALGHCRCCPSPPPGWTAAGLGAPPSPPGGVRSMPTHIPQAPDR